MFPPLIIYQRALFAAHEAIFTVIRVFCRGFIAAAGTRKSSAPGHTRYSVLCITGHGRRFRRRVFVTAVMSGGANSS
jgi:hypothetical protein